VSKVVVKILKYEVVNNFFLINISIIDILKKYGQSILSEKPGRTAKKLQRTYRKSFKFF
jgi:hypothetical protein